MLPVQTVVLATLAKPAVIFKLGLKNDKSHTFKYLHSTAACFDSHNSLSLKIIDKADSRFDLEIKELLHINWTNPNLNTQQNHLDFHFSLRLSFASSCFCFLLSLSFIIFIISDISYRHLLLSFTAIFRYYFISLQHTWCHTFTLHLLFLFYMILIINIFYCLNYTLLLLHLIITHLINTFYNDYIITICHR